MHLLETDAAEGVPEGFLELPASLYAEDPAWTPEEPAGVRGAFSGANPWFASGTARAFCIPGLARAAAFHQPALRIDGEPVAYFGYFETSGHPAADEALMARVVEWAGRQGARVLYGPVNFSTAFIYRLRLSAEPGAGAYFGEPYNLPGYPARLERLGFRLHLRYLTQRVPAERALLARDERRVDLERAVGRGYRFRALTREQWLAHAGELCELTNTAFARNFGFTPLPASMFRAHFAGVVSRLCPVGSVAAFGPGGDIAGAYVLIPDYSPLTAQRAGAARVPASQVSYDRHLPALARQRPLSCVFKTVAVSPRHRQRGLSGALMISALDQAGGLYDSWSVALVREDNFSRRFFEEVEGDPRWYGLYSRRLRS